MVRLGDMQNRSKRRAAAHYFPVYLARQRASGQDRLCAGSTETKLLPVDPGLEGATTPVLEDGRGAEGNAPSIPASRELMLPDVRAGNALPQSGIGRWECNR